MSEATGEFRFPSEELAAQAKTPRPPKTRRRQSGTMQRAMGDYELVRRLATGGMAEVYLAERVRDWGFRRPVALKKILPQYARDPAFRDMFREEAILGASLQHPQIVQTTDYGEHDGEPYLVMEYIPGTNINRLMKRSRSLKRAVPVDIVVHIGACVARALAYAHRQTFEDGSPKCIVHRDVSPANILLSEHGDVKLTDFGIALANERARHTRSGNVRGKLGYMSPEQVAGAPVDAPTDVFTLGVVLAELLAGKPLFSGRDDIEILVKTRDVDLEVLDETEIPRDVRRVLLAALTKNASARPSASALEEAFLEIRRRRGMAPGHIHLASYLQTLGFEAQVEQSDRSSDNAALVDTGRLPSEARALLERVTPVLPRHYVAELVRGDVGPISIAKLIELAATGQLPAATIVRQEGGDSKPASEWNELAPFVSEESQFRDAPEDAEQGFFRGASLLPTVFHIMRERKTGALQLHADQGGSQGPGRRKRIFFEAGRPVSVISTDRRELLGEYLVENGHCLRMEIEMALALMPRHGGRLGDTLVSLGLMRPIELFRVMNAQTRDRFLEAFRWRRGSWFFEENTRGPSDSFPMGGQGYEILTEVVRSARGDELEAALSPAWEHVLRLTEYPPVAMGDLEMPRGWSRIIALANQQTIAQVIGTATAHGVDVIEAYRSIYLALTTGVLVADDPGML